MFGNFIATLAPRVFGNAEGSGSIDPPSLCSFCHFNVQHISFSLEQSWSRKIKRDFQTMKERNVRFGVFTAVTMKNAVFLDIKPSPYLTGNTLLLRYRAQPVNAV
jgi:hypothetical protein